MPNELPALTRLQTHLHAVRESLLARWKERVFGDSQVESANVLSKSEFLDHIPLILELLENKLLSADAGALESSTHLRVASEHGDHRWHQGYTMEETAREWGHLHLVVLDEIEAFCLHDFSPEETASGAWARRTWARIVDEGITRSAARFDELQKAEALGHVNDLQETLEKVRIFEQERGVLLRHATHDMRGSLSVVRGATSLLDWQQIEGLAPEDRQNIFRILATGVESLGEMMADMLDLARLEAGAEEFGCAAFDASELLRDLYDSSQILALEKNLDLRRSGPDSLLVEGDAIKVRRIAQNLLLNAIKYTHTGHVRLDWRALSEDRWELEISDSGPGLGNSNAAPILAQMSGGPETPLHTSRNSFHAPGEGVGLSIVKRLCELCHATLFADSNENGSCFRVIFPANYRNS